MAMATRSRPGALGAADWLQDELSPGRSGVYDSAATHCFCTLWCSGLTQPIRSARTGSGRSKDRVNARGRQYRDVSKRQPAYLYDVGDHLAAVWAPALEPSDATDPRFGDIIANGQQFKIKDLDLRNAQQYGPLLLMDRWREIEKILEKTIVLHERPRLMRCGAGRWKLSGSL